MRVVGGAVTRLKAVRRHVPVLLAEVLRHLAIRPGDRVLDCTVGLGGHAEALLRQGATVLGVDRDPAARALAAGRLESFRTAFRFSDLGDGTYASVAEILVEQGERFDAILADLGVSSLQLDDEARGFSIASGTEADMRMSPESESALALIDRLEADELADVIFRYGEERRSRRVARALKEARAQGVARSSDLAEVVSRAVGGWQHRHPARRTFQALRIAVNDEIGQLERFLAVLPRLLAPGGRAVVISFHSLEDRLVKQSFRDGLKKRRYREISRSVAIADAEELARNRRAAPAKLRWALAPGDREVRP